MKLNDEERQIMVNLEYEKALSFLGQAEKFPTDASKLYIKLQTMREKSDYNCVYVTTEEEMLPLIEPLKAFIAKVGDLIKEKE